MDSLTSQILKGNCTPNEFINFLETQPTLEDIQQLSWAQLPIWKVFLSTNPKDLEMQQFMQVYKQLGVDLFELDNYKNSLFSSRLSRAANGYELSLETLIQTFELAENLELVEKNNKALWSFCIKNDLSESDKLTALEHYYKHKGNFSIRGDYGSIFKYIAALSSIKLWSQVSAWVDFSIEEDFLVDGEGAERIEFCAFLVENKIPIVLWGEDTFSYALRDDDLILLDKLLEYGYQLDLENNAILDRAKGLEALKKLVNTGISIEPKSTYPFDSIVYTTIYNLKGYIDCRKEYSDDSYAKPINRTIEKLIFLLQQEARLDHAFDYEGEYPPLASMLHEYTEIYDVVKQHTNSTNIRFIEAEIEKLKTPKDPWKNATHAILIETKDKTVKIPFQKASGGWTDLYNSLSIIDGLEPETFQKEGIYYASKTSTLSYHAVLDLLINEAGLISNQLAKNLQEA